MRYFKIEKIKNETKVSVYQDPEKTVLEEIDPENQKYIFFYIEKYFISRQFVKKVLQEYIQKTGAKWYDLLSNTRTLKNLFAHKLKNRIVSVIYAESPLFNQNTNQKSKK